MRDEPAAPRSRSGATDEPAPRLSVVVPTLREAERLPALLGDLAGLARHGVAYEVVVADAGSDDGTPGIAAALGARVVRSAPGRGVQLAAAVGAARADLLCALHADVRLPPPAVAELARVALERPGGTHAFRLAIDAPGLAYRIVERSANARSRWLGLPYGDQGLVVHRADLDAAGGYRPWPLMEDVALVRALGRLTSVRLLPASVHVSARRWQRDGVTRRTLRNWLLLLRFLLGESPERLAERYRAGG